MSLLSRLTWSWHNTYSKIINKEKGASRKKRILEFRKQAILTFRKTKKAQVLFSLAWDVQ